MLGLPQATEIRKIIPKKKIFEYFTTDMNTARRRSFDAQIARITLVNEISPHSTNISAGENIGSFFVILVNLRIRGIDDKNISFLSKVFRQHLLIVLEYEEQYQLAIYQTTSIRSSWMAVDDCKINLIGLDLDTVWNNIVIQIGNINVEQGHSLDEQIQIDEQKAKLQIQIEGLDKKIRKEVQAHKKYEMHQLLLKLKKKMEDLSNG
jgi:hypothetical protein